MGKIINESLKDKCLSIRKSKVVENIFSLGLVQIANYAIPIVIIPIVVRALGVDSFGKVAYAQNIVSYLTILIVYGFEYSATQDVAINRDDKLKLRTIFWTVIWFRIILLILSFIALFILYFFFPKVHEDPVLYFYAALINVGMVLFPTWFFQGIEKMRNMAFFNFIIKAVGAVLVVLFVAVPSDCEKYILILSLSYIAVGAFSFVYVIKKYDLSSYHKNKDFSKKIIFKGFPIFLNNAFTSFYAAIGVTIIGVYLSDYYVGLYSGAYKIIQAVIMLTTMPISYALFPIMSRRFNESLKDGWSFFRKSFIIIIILSLFVFLLVFIFSSFAVKVFLGNEFNDSISVLRLMAIIPSLVIIATILTVQGLYALQLQRYSPFVGFMAGLVGFITNVICVPRYGIYGAVYAWILAEVIEILIDGSIILRYKKKIIG